MTDWVISATLGVDATPDAMAAWQDRLAAFDALAARIPRLGQITITLHVAADDMIKATTVAHDAVQDAAGVEPVAIETITEAEQERRADEPTLPELMSAAEIAEQLGVSRQRVHQLRDTAAFPAPLADLRGGAIWDAAAIRKFDQTWTRKPGPPPGHRQTA